jgi:hypothetical protein
MLALVSMGQVAKLPLSTAMRSVVVEGLKRTLCKNLIVLAMVPAGTTLLIWAAGV